MTRFLQNRIAVVGVTVCLLLAGALTTSRAAEDKKTPTTHYIDRDKKVEMDVPLSWERRFSDDSATRFIFATGGKSAANAQPPEFTMVVAGPDASNESLKSLAAFVAQAKKQAAADGKDAKFEADKEQKVDGEKAISFTGSKTTKAGAAKLYYLVTLHNGVGYAISFACDPATFDAEFAAAKPWIDSIKWGK